MLAARTVFVIGAGASCEYGFPDGTKLRRRITSLLDLQFDAGHLSRGDSAIADAMRLLCRSSSSNVIDNSAWRTHLGEARELVAGLVHAASIDRYLDALEAHQHRPAMARLGKLAIVRSILDAEKHSVLWTREPNPTLPTTGDEKWLSALFSIMEAGTKASALEDIFKNAYFICFNYDRSIEQFFSVKISNFFRIPHDRAREVVKNHLQIVRPYGAIGESEASGWALNPEYGSEDIPPVRLLSLSDGIKTFTEQYDNGLIKKRILEFLSGAERVVFLGYGFHDQNMAILSSPSSLPIRRAFATVLHQPVPDHSYRAEQIVRAFNPMGDVNGLSTEHVVYEAMAAGEFLWKYAGTLGRA